MTRLRIVGALRRELAAERGKGTRTTSAVRTLCSCTVAAAFSWLFCGLRLE